MLLLSSFWNISQHSWESEITYIRESSGKRDKKEDCKLLSISLIMIMKRIGPRTVPYGTPERTAAGLDSAPLAETWSV